MPCKHRLWLHPEERQRVRIRWRHQGRDKLADQIVGAGRRSAFQLAAVTGPVVAGIMLGARFNAAFIGMLILGCAVMAFIALAVERRIPARANGVRTSAAELSPV